MNLKSVFPRASQSFLDANPLSSPSNGSQTSPTGKVDVRNVRRGRLNKTESEFAMILEAMKRKGEILDYEFEGITLRFSGVKYTPDFVVFTSSPVPSDCKFIEVKGPFIKGNRERAVERFRHAKTYWHQFKFELHQKTKEGWKQII